MKYGDLFDFLEGKHGCNFQWSMSPRRHDSLKEWKCFGDLRFTKSFCKENGLDFVKVKKAVEKEGGYCDCEVIFNAARRISERKTMPKGDVE